ncbi:MAG: hypothetical protein QOI83_4643, partial [Streptomycetaceae bacterium]|nr:hypothetical protein [Streptomycetaceae bacterium]
MGLSLPTWRLRVCLVRVLQSTMAQVALTGTGDRLEALRDIMAGLLSLDEPRKRIAGMM